MTNSASDDSSASEVARERRRAIDRLVLWATLRSVIAGAVLISIYAILPVGNVQGARIVFRLIVAALITVGTVLWSVHSVNKSALPLPRAMEALVVTVFVTMAAFATAYLNLSSHDPASFSEPLGKVSALYFTVTTLATVGYGDITPETDTAQISVMVQMVVNVAVVGTAAKVIIEKARIRRNRARTIIVADPDDED